MLPAAQMLDEPALFQLADPVMACTATVMYEGDTHGWHFDLNDFVVSILLQAPEAGGTFDFAPTSERTARKITPGRRRPRWSFPSGALDQSRGRNVAAFLRPQGLAPRAADTRHDAARHCPIELRQKARCALRK